MKPAEIYAIIKQHNGTINHGINWSWALFDSLEQAQAAFDLIEPHVEHRGLYPATDTEGPAFRFR